MALKHVENLTLPELLLKKSEIEDKIYKKGLEIDMLQLMLNKVTFQLDRHIDLLEG